MAAQQLKDYALVVGIENYADGDFLEILNGPKNDARNFVKWLSSPTGGNLPPANVNPYLLVSDENGSSPRAGDIVDAIKKLLALAPPTQRIGRRLYIVLAGHGVGPDLDDAGLLTAEATEDVPTYIEGRRYANLFRGRAVFEEVVLMMDCCRDYDGELPASIFPFKTRLVPGAVVKRFYAYATGFGRAAREKEINNEVSGIFSHAVMAGLNGGAIDGEGRITGPSLERYIRKKVKSLLPQGVDQPSDIRCDLDLVFAEGFPPATVNVTLQATVPHDRVVVLQGNGFKPVVPGATVTGAGQYQAQLPIGKTYVFQLVDAAGAVLKQDGRAIEDAEEVVHVQL